MASGNVTISAAIGGINAAGSAVRNGVGQLSIEKDPVDDGLTGNMASVNSARNAGTVDGMETGHGLVGTDIIALFQVADEAAGSIVCRYGITVDTANANDIIFDNTPAAAGDVLPIDDVPVIVSKYTDQFNVDFGGDDILQMVLSSNINMVVQFTENDTTELLVVILKAGEPYVWSLDNGFTNPLAGDAIGLINIAPGGSDGVFKMGTLLDVEV